MSLEYTDILIRVHRFNTEEEYYPVEATLSDGSFFGDARMYVDRKALLALAPLAESYGQALFHTLFSGPILQAYDKATGIAEAKNDGRLRVRLWIDDKAPELQVLPWERMYHRHKGKLLPLSCSALTPFSRFSGLRIRQADPLQRSPIRLLMVVSNPQRLPGGLKPIQVESELEFLCEALFGEHPNHQFEATVLPGRTGISEGLRSKLEQLGCRVEEGPASLDSILRLLPSCHILHILAHGHFARESRGDTGTAALLLEGEEIGNKGVSLVKDVDLATSISAVGHLPHLVFLAACESAKQDEEHAFMGLAPKLVQAGVPAVVAMQARVSADLVSQLTADFYKNLLDHGRVDLALNQARLLLFEQDSVDWAIPVLFSRLEENRLIEADEEETRDTPTRVSKRFLLNAALVTGSALFLALWFYRHFYDFAFGSAAFAGVCSVLFFVFSWILKDRLRPPLVNLLDRSSPTKYLAAALSISVLLLGVTSSIYLKLDEDSAEPWGEIEVEILENGETSRGKATLSSSNPRSAQLSFLDLSWSHLEFRVTKPAIFKAKERNFYPWSAISVRVPSSFQERAGTVVRVVPKVDLSSRFARASDTPGILHNMKLQVDDREPTIVRDVRREQTFFVGNNTDELKFIRDRFQDDSALERYLSGLPIAEEAKSQRLQAWRDHSINVEVTLEGGKRLLIAFVRVPTSKPESTTEPHFELICKETVTLSEGREDERIKTVFISPR